MNNEEKIALKEQLSIVKQTMLEVSAAQNNGPWWFTRGEQGLYQQVATWVRNGNEALNMIDKILDDTPQ